MSKTRPPYAPEFRRQIIDLVRAGRDPTDLARESEPSAQAIRNWVREADRGGGGPGGGTLVLSAAEKEELVRLRRENRQLRLERDILSRAAARVSPGRPARCRPGLRVHERETCAVFPIAAMARVLGVSKAGYHAWRQRGPSAHAVADAALLKQSRTIHLGSGDIYGAPRVHAALAAQGAQQAASASPGACARPASSG